MSLLQPALQTSTCEDEDTNLVTDLLVPCNVHAMDPWFLACTTKLNLARAGAFCVLLIVQPAGHRRQSQRSAALQLLVIRQSASSEAPAKLEVRLVKLVQGVSCDCSNAGLRGRRTETLVACLDTQHGLAKLHRVSIVADMVLFSGCSSR